MPDSCFEFFLKTNKTKKQNKNTNMTIRSYYHSKKSQNQTSSPKI